MPGGLPAPAGARLRSRITRKAIGTDEIRISASAGAAAWAKKASEAADQTAVERVLKPSGPRISVAGSSFMVTRKTKAAPINTPGPISGTVMVCMTWRELRPMAAGCLFQPRADLQQGGARRAQRRRKE